MIGLEKTNEGTNIAEEVAEILSQTAPTNNSSELLNYEDQPYRVYYFDQDNQILTQSYNGSVLPFQNSATTFLEQLTNQVPNTQFQAAHILTAPEKLKLTGFSAKRLHSDFIHPSVFTLYVGYVQYLKDITTGEYQYANPTTVLEIDLIANKSFLHNQEVQSNIIIPKGALIHYNYKKSNGKTYGDQNGGLIRDWIKTGLRFKTVD